MARSSDSFFLLALFRDKTFQAREIRRVLGFSMLYLLITTVLIGFFYHQMLGNLVDGVAPLFFVSEDMSLVNDAIPSLTALLGKWVAVMLLVNVIVTAALSIYITRKLGHPIMAIKRSLREIGNGNLDVRLRSTDKSEFGEISNEMNRAMHTVRQQIHAAKHEIAKTDSDEEAIENCKKALDYFQIEPDSDTAAA